MFVQKSLPYISSLTMSHQRHFIFSAAHVLDIFHPPRPRETQIEASRDSKTIWDELVQKSRADNRVSGSGHNCMLSSSHVSLLVPCFHQALMVASQERDPRIRKVDTVSECPISADVPESVRSADQIQVVIGGGHKIVGHALWYLGASENMFST